jgi:hypothetical protein
MSVSRRRSPVLQLKSCRGVGLGFNIDCFQCGLWRSKFEVTRNDMVPGNGRGGSRWCKIEVLACWQDPEKVPLGNLQQWLGFCRWSTAKKMYKMSLKSTKLWGIYEAYIHIILCGYTIINHPLNHHKWLVWTIKIWMVYGIVLPTLFYILGIPSAIPPVVHSWVVAPKDREIPLE